MDYKHNVCCSSVWIKTYCDLHAFGFIITGNLDLSLHVLIWQILSLVCSKLFLNIDCKTKCLYFYFNIWHQNKYTDLILLLKPRGKQVLYCTKTLKLHLRFKAWLFLFLTKINASVIFEKIRLWFYYIILIKSG